MKKRYTVKWTETVTRSLWILAESEDDAIKKAKYAVQMECADDRAGTIEDETNHDDYKITKIQSLGG